MKGFEGLFLIWVQYIIYRGFFRHRKFLFRPLGSQGVMVAVMAAGFVSRSAIRKMGSWSAIFRNPSGFHQLLEGPGVYLADRWMAVALVQLIQWFFYQLVDIHRYPTTSVENPCFFRKCHPFREWRCIGNRMYKTLYLLGVLSDSAVIDILLIYPSSPSPLCEGSILTWSKSDGVAFSLRFFRNPKS